MIIPNTFFKSKTDCLRQEYLCTDLFLIMCDMLLWCKENNIPPLVTGALSTAQEDKKLKRVSTSHREGRAFDLRSRDFSETQRKDFIKHFTDKYGKLGALSASTKKPTLIVYHDSGQGLHFHVQVRKDLTDKKKLTRFKESLDEQNYG